VPTLPQFSNQQIIDKARALGLVDDDRDVSANALRIAHRELANEYAEGLRTASRPEQAARTVTVTVEITLDGVVVGASVTHVPFPEGTTPP